MLAGCRRPVAVAIAAVVMTGLTACGSTVQLRTSQVSGDGLGGSATTDGSGSASGPGGTGATPSLTTDGGSVPGAASGAVSGLPQATVPGPGGGSAGSGGPTVPSSGYRPGVPGVSQGITPTTISLGIVVLKGGAAFAQGLGFSVSFGDTKVEFDAALKDVNARGGIFGRKVVPVYAYEDLTNPADAQTSLCPTFTQDNHVFAVLMPFNPGPDTASCIAKAHTLLLNNSTLQPDNSADPNYRKWLFGPSLAAYGRYPSSLVPELIARGWFNGSGGKAGLLATDAPAFMTPARTVFKPLLERAGIATDLVAVNQTTYSQDLQNAVLRFRREGISRVLFVQSGAGVPLYFMEAANEQQFFPKYALTSYESPNWFLAQNAPKQQLVNSVGIGWQPFMDVAVAKYPTTALERRCFALQRAEGEDNKDRLSDITSTSTCDLVWSFEAAARAAGPDLTSDAWRAGYRAVGTGYHSVTTLATDWSSGRNDGAGAYRWLAWDGSCSCFGYAGPQRPMAS